MDKVKLYKAYYTQEVFFLAKDGIDSAALAVAAKRAMNNEVSGYLGADSPMKISEVASVLDVPDEWLNVLPWGEQQASPERTIKQLLTMTDK